MHEVAAFNYLSHEAYELTVGSHLLTLRRSLVIDQGMQLFHLAFCLDVMCNLGFRKDGVFSFWINSCWSFTLMFLKILVIAILHLFTVLLILAVLLIL